MSCLTEAYPGGSWRDGRAGWRFRFTFDLDIIQSLKRQVPPQCREWHEDTREWWVAQEYEEELLALFPAFEAYLRQPQLF